MIDREIGPYRVKDQIPFRGPGRLFEGVHAVLGRKVAIREIPSDVFTDDLSRERFLRAAKIVQRHATEYLAAVHLCREVSGTILLVTEHFPSSLGDHLIREGGVRSGDVVAVGRALLQGVKFLHENGIVHGNICEETVAFASDGSPKLTSWGVRRSCAGKSGEGADGDVAGDLQAVGELLQRLEKAGSSASGGAPSSSCAAQGGGRTGIQAVIAKALAPDRADRYPTAEEFLADLERLPQGRGELCGGGRRDETEIFPLLRFPGRRVSWGLLFGLMLVPLVFATMTRKTDLPKVPHKGVVERGSESDASPGGALPGLLPIRKTAVKKGDDLAQQKKEPDRKRTKGEKKEERE
ncbi:hypothetical protein LPW11_18630 [Geomonas sp. RF6]|uniref:serine/threonine protein kinase n=1 Tax=Geomonas sp. RF6 TaxID=2897342 RepID=UPI001E38A5FA|nr:protein kinase [Geomonas sp. RF6]UFS69890.1 hypothetical protein LPW11_18630 [Geomonas sp. RF6]